jgi:Rod binding domain-containing protein
MTALALTTPTTGYDTASIAQAQMGNLMKVAGAKGVTMDKIEAVASDFESQFISQMLQSMYDTLDIKDSFGGSEAEETFQSMMVDQYGKVLARSGGIGVADQIKRSMLAMQEIHQGK